MTGLGAAAGAGRGDIDVSTLHVLLAHFLLAFRPAATVRRTYDRIAEAR